jgi:hypothetical protein
LYSQICEYVYPLHGAMLTASRGAALDRAYDLFEVLDDGTVLWRCTVEGREEAISKLQELAAATRNELRLMHLPSQTLIARMNEKAKSQ